MCRSAGPIPHFVHKAATKSRLAWIGHLERTDSPVKSEIRASCWPQQRASELGNGRLTTTFSEIDDHLPTSPLSTLTRLLHRVSTTSVAFLFLHESHFDEQFQQHSYFCNNHPQFCPFASQGIMTSTSTTPDISGLSLSSKPSQQRLHDTYDYEGNSPGNGRTPYHFATSPPIPAQSQYNPLGLNQSPLKNKTMRGGLPSVRFSSILPLPAQI